MSLLVSPSQVLHLDANVSTTLTTFADVTGLSFPMVANADYLLEAFLIYTAAATTTGIQVGLNGPAGPVGVLGEWHAYTAVATQLARQFNAYDAGGQPTTGVIAANAAQFAGFAGLVRNGATAGPAVLRFASEVAGSQVTIVAGSLLRVQQTAPVATVNTVERFGASAQLTQNIAEMQNNMRASAQTIQAGKNSGAIPTFAAAQQAFRDAGRAFLQRLDRINVIFTGHTAELSDGMTALGILPSDMQARYALLRTWATNLNTAVVTNQTEMDTLVAGLLAAIPPSILPW